MLFEEQTKMFGDWAKKLPEVGDFMDQNQSNKNNAACCPHSSPAAIEIKNPGPSEVFSWIVNGKYNSASPASLKWAELLQELDFVLMYDNNQGVFFEPSGAFQYKKILRVLYKDFFLTDVMGQKNFPTNYTFSAEGYAQGVNLVSVPQSASRPSFTKPSVEDRNLCIICCEREREVLFFPCRHATTCLSCVFELIRHSCKSGSGFYPECPCCKKRVTSSVVYYG